MKTIITHPDNVESLYWMKSKHESGPPCLFGIQFRTDPYMEKDKATGRYIAPDGKSVFADEVCVEERFVTYGPEDIHYLLARGIITDEREALYVVIDNQDFMTAPLIPPISFITSYSSFGT